MYIYTYMYIYTHVTYVYYYFRWDVFRLRLLDLERNIPSVRHCSSSEIRQFHGNRTFLDPQVGYGSKTLIPCRPCMLNSDPSWARKKTDAQNPGALGCPSELLSLQSPGKRSRLWKKIQRAIGKSWKVHASSFHASIQECWRKNMIHRLFKHHCRDGLQVTKSQTVRWGLGLTEGLMVTNPEAEQADVLGWRDLEVPGLQHLQLPWSPQAKPKNVGVSLWFSAPGILLPVPGPMAPGP